MGLRLFRLVLISLLFTFILSPSISHAKKDPRKEYLKIQRELKKRKEALLKTRKREVSILKEMEQLNRELGELKRGIKRLRSDLRRRSREISGVRREIEQISSVLRKQKRFLEKQLQSMQKFGVEGVDTVIRAGKDPRPGILHLSFADQVRLLLSSSDLPQLIRRWRSLERIASYEYRVMKEYSENIQGLREKEEKLRGLLKELKREKKELYSKERSLRDKKKRKRELLASVRKERDLYKQMISELKESSRRLRKLIEESEKEKKYAQKGFKKMKKKLPWPVNGRVALPYGSYRDPKFKTPVFRNGIHIKAKDGAIVRAVYSGRVVYADWFKGYGKVVIVDHGEGYHTVYANLNDIFLKKGDIIKKGEEIGHVGESGTINAPGLYFEVRYRGKPVNPLHWLKNRYKRKRR